MIIVVGSVNMDLVIHTNKIPKIGETVIGHGFTTSPGGKGANQAVAAARLNSDVSVIGCVGEDKFGQTLLEGLRSEGILIEGIEHSSEKMTGVASITVNGEGDNAIVVDPGANFQLTPAHIDSKKDIFLSGSVLLAQLETPIDTITRALVTASEKGMITILNPAPAMKYEPEIYQYIDFITPNETECEILTGIRVENMNDARRAVAFFMNLGVGGVIITAGENGVYYTDKEAVCFKESYSVDVLDTTAAGDAFNAALAVALSKGTDIHEAINFCTIVGALTVSKYGAQSSLPTMADVHKFARDRQIKLCNKLEV